MRLAVLQMNSGIDPAANARTIAQAIAEAKGQGGDILFTPEMSGLLDRNRKRAAQSIVAEEEDLVLAAVRDAARQHELWVHFGSQPVDAGDGKWRNRGFVIGPDGGIAARYDKIHLFDVALDSGESWRESKVYAGGDAPVAVDLEGARPEIRLGMSICYDVRFPMLYERLSDGGANILSVPSAFTRPTGAAHWHVLLRARAIEATAFVVAAAQTGEHEDGRATYGHSLVVDPWGEVLMDMGEEPGLRCVDIDLGKVERVRQQLPSLANRRKIGDLAVP